VVSNTAGTVTSSAATLTVNPAPVAPTITTQPANQTVTAGQTATFTVVAAGTAPLSYQWQKNSVNIAGATLASYTTPTTTTADSGATFSVVVSNTAGTVTSSAATLTVNPAPVAPTITTQPVSQTVTAGQTATFNGAGGGHRHRSATSGRRTRPTSPELLFGELHHADNNHGGQRSDLRCGGEQHRGNGDQQCRDADVNPAPVAPTITTQPVNQTVTADRRPPSRCWRRAPHRSATSGRRTRSTSPELLWQATPADDNHGGQRSDFLCGGEQHRGTVTSSAATLTVNPAPVAPDDHHAAGESDGDGRTDGHLHGAGGGHRTARLPVAEELGQHRRSYFGELHHADNNHGGQRSDLRCGGEQHRGNSDQQCRDADGEPRSGGADGSPRSR